MKLVLLVVASLAASALAYREKKIVCYFGSWAVYRPGNGHFDISDFDAKLCTHMIYTFLGLDGGLIKVLDPWADLPDDGGMNGFGKFLGLRERSPSTKFMVAIGGWNEGSTKYSELVAEPETRRAFVEDAVRFLKKYGFDGLDFDWEYPNQRGGVEADKENFVLLLRELREAFDKEDLLLSAAFGASVTTTRLSYILPQVTECVHFVNLMTYDYHVAADNVTGLNAPLFPGSEDKNGKKSLNVYSSVSYWISEGVPLEKIVLGVPFYGRTFTLADPNNLKIGAPTVSAGLPGPYTQEPGAMGYNEICEMFMKDKWFTYFVRKQHVPYAVRGDQWISYDDPWSMKKKADLINKLKLGGVMIWSIETDDFLGICGNKYPLLKILNSILDEEP